VVSTAAHLPGAKQLVGGLPTIAGAMVPEVVADGLSVINQELVVIAQLSSAAPNWARLQWSVTEADELPAADDFPCLGTALQRRSIANRVNEGRGLRKVHA
jgi:hypothetical protein